MNDSFSSLLLAWHAVHGRHDLPWQNTRDPYRVWLSEIMLQQTQVATVIPYYQRFLKRFPTLADLASAAIEEVMPLWSGLGYYARARNLHACAQAVQREYGGRFPDDAEVLVALPGIGRSTAHAIADFCFEARLPILDGNVKRVLCRCFGIEGVLTESAIDKQLWQLAHELLPQAQVDTYIQAQMDLGATVCTRTRPDCETCPLASICVAKATERVADLPMRKAKSALPQREQTVLVLLRSGEAGEGVLLERRPLQGIWGGLLALPVLPEGHDAATEARQLGCQVEEEFRSLPELRHTFTHFHLRLLPLMAKATPLPHAAEDNTRQWVSLCAIDTAALPTPVRRILESLASQLTPRAENLSKQ